MPLFGKKKENKKENNSSFSSVSQQVTANGNTRLTVTKTRTVTTYDKRYSTTSEVSVSDLSKGFSTLSLPSSNDKFYSVRPSLPSLQFTPAINAKTATDAKPFTPSIPSKINLNYQSPYQRSSPTYRSFQGTVAPTKPLEIPKPIKIPTRNESKSPTASKIADKGQKIRVIKTGKFLDETVDSVPTYKTRSKKRGEVLIINNIIFNEKQMSQREGAEVDDKNLEDLFDQLGFTVTLKKNLKKSKMESMVKSFSKQSSLKRVDISVVIIMSHGTNHDRLGGYTEIYGVDDEGCSVDSLIQYFTAENCPNMKGKPKIFIFQCCRGNNEEFIQNDAKPIDKDQGYADMLIAYSTLPGFVSYRDPKTGTWYIQTLCEVFSQHAHKNHVEDMLKIVDDKLASLSRTNRQISSYENRGFKRCYLHPI